MDDDTLTREMTERAKIEIARDFSTWLRDAGADILATCKSHDSKCYTTERTLAYFTARTVAALGDHVARGAVIEYVAGLSAYIERDMLEAEIVAAFRKRGI